MKAMVEEGGLRAVEQPPRPGVLTQALAALPANATREGCTPRRR
jgi:hypothetical protein